MPKFQIPAQLATLPPEHRLIALLGVLYEVTCAAADKHALHPEQKDEIALAAGRTLMTYAGTLFQYPQEFIAALQAAADKLGVVIRFTTDELEKGGVN